MNTERSGLAFSTGMSALYLATRSDARSILKVGRSSNPARRCKDLESGHCFQVKLIAV